MSHPPIILLNTVDPNLENLYDVQEILAEHFQVSVDTIHAGLFPFEVRPLTTQKERDTFCDDLEALERDLLRIESDYGATFQQLGKSSRIILLLNGSDQNTYIEYAVAFGLLVAAMSGTWPDIASVQFDVDNTQEFHIMRELHLQALLNIYSQMEHRQITTYATHHLNTYHHEEKTRVSQNAGEK